MSVYFSKKIDSLLENLEGGKLKGRVGLKVHFGEEGNETYLNPEISRMIYEKVSSMGYDVSLVECNVLYKGSRTNEKNHIKTAKKHGFGFGSIDILDGEDDGDDLVLPVKEGVVDKAKVGGGLEKYDSLIVLSHFKGHAATGFGGAFKNLGMGLGSRAGKLHMHSEVSPSIKKSNCTKCGLCIDNCDVDAIKMTKQGAEIDSDQCIGCAMCIAVCEFNAVRIPWGGSTNKNLQKKIIDYSHAIIDYLSSNIIYVNVLENITKDCDCVGKPMRPIVEDIGILLSDDPVAIDKASLDLVADKSNGKINQINSTNNEYKINYAQEKGLGDKKYNLIR